LPAGDINAGPSDLLFTAAADYLLLRIVTRRHNVVGTSAVNGSSFSTLKVPDVLPERAAMEDLRQILVLKASTSLQHALLVADDTVGASLQPTTTGDALHFAALDATHVHFNMRVGSTVGATGLRARHMAGLSNNSVRGFRTELLRCCIAAGWGTD
jgi:hypothetical protein